MDDGHAGVWWKFHNYVREYFIHISWRCGDFNVFTKQCRLRFGSKETFCISNDDVNGELELLWDSRLFRRGKVSWNKFPEKEWTCCVLNIEVPMNILWWKIIFILSKYTRREYTRYPKIEAFRHHVRERDPWNLERREKSSDEEFNSLNSLYNVRDSRFVGIVDFVKVKSLRSSAHNPLSFANQL